MFKHYIPQFPSYFNSPINQYWDNEKLKGILAEQQRKFIVKNLNPFNICPRSVTFWFPITKFVSVGMTVSSLQRIIIVIRQQIEPNRTIFLSIRILQLKIPFPLTLLTMFSSFGLWVNGAVNNLLENATTQLMNEQDIRLNNLEEQIQSLFPDIAPEPSLLPPDIPENVWESLNPFNLSPSMTVNFPIYKTHTSFNLTFMNLQRIAISIRQILEPQDIIYTLIRFIELRVPFPLSILALFLSIGLIINGSVNEFEQGTRNGIMTEVNRIFQEHRKK